ncbi:major facilitator superfamily protein [Stylonychia lemnae]|uniref:Major facilitator superfamily protein n=1 Tax=Stylonychia lemnae TaxID=5949 RepID=A0A078ATR6_STYLE|nr:major facilitator superfamily protein [Stylonychia lemnae]|eukprot:CDW85639.1 major facilitator superfamily protein [Stylonychia lemnae]
MTKFLYATIVLCYLVDHFDLGIFAQAAASIQQDLKITQSGVGLLESGMYIGNIIGCILCPFLFKIISSKWLIINASILNALLLCPFYFSSNFWLLVSCRIILGIFQVIFVVYFPVWIDQCAPKHLRTIWLTVMFLQVPLGIVLGYGGAALLKSVASWKWAFMLQTVIMIAPLPILFALIPKIYYTAGPEQKEDEQQIMLTRWSEGQNDDKAIRTIGNSVPFSPNGSRRIGMDFISLEVLRNSLDQSQDQTMIKKSKSYDANQELEKSKEVKQEEYQIKELPLGRVVYNLLLNPSYIFSIISMTNICFIVTGLQYWATYYMINVLNGKETQVNLLYSATVITGPAVGALSGGIFSTKFLGGYTSSKAIYFCFITFLCLIVVSIPMPYTDNIFIAMGLVWLQLFFGGAIEPNLTGIILNTVSAIERPTASSFAILFYNVFGYLPAPYFYGLLADWTAEYNSEGENISRTPIKVLMYSSTLGALSLLLAILLRRRSQLADFKRVCTSFELSNENIPKEKIAEMIVRTQLASNNDQSDSKALEKFVKSLSLGNKIDISGKSIDYSQQLLDNKGSVNSPNEDINEDANKIKFRLDNQDRNQMLTGDQRIFRSNQDFSNKEKEMLRRTHGMTILLSRSAQIITQ